ncbi:hypothetical protein B0H19DRAFT_1064204 [Mycena capillaripes]|nr:hypothetical protein B0H19DRAFT_1064204 [Mycena capillaripes]
MDTLTSLAQDSDDARRIGEAMSPRESVPLRRSGPRIVGSSRVVPASQPNCGTFCATVWVHIGAYSESNDYEGLLNYRVVTLCYIRYILGVNERATTTIRTALCYVFNRIFPDVFRRWKPRTEWYGSQVHKEIKPCSLLLLDYVVRGALLTPVDENGNLEGTLAFSCRFVRSRHVTTRSRQSTRMGTWKERLRFLADSLDPDPRVPTNFGKVSTQKKNENGSWLKRTVSAGSESVAKSKMSWQIGLFLE